MKTNLKLFILTLLSFNLAAQSYNVNGNWMYNPTNTIKTITATQDGLKSIIDGNDKIDYFTKVGKNKYQSNSKSTLYLEFKSSDLHLQYNTASGKQNTWTRYGNARKEPDPGTNTTSSSTTSSGSGGGSTYKKQKNEIGTKGARPYNTAVGVRAGLPFAISYKKFQNETSAVEAWGGVNSLFFNFGLAFQYHREFDWLEETFSFVEKGQWYFGLGVTGYSWRGFYDGLGLGATGFLGYRFNIPGTPFEVGADWQPSFALGNSGAFSGFGGGYGGAYIRYILD